MDYDSSNGKAVLSDGPYMPLSKPFPLTDNLQIQRTRQIHLIFNGILFILSVIDLILGINGVKFLHDQGIYVIVYHIIQASAWILLNGFGLFVAYKYHRIGLIVFAWLNIILIVVLGILIMTILSVVGWLFFSKKLHQNAGPSRFIAILSIVGIAFILIRIFVIKIALKLARLIKENKKIIDEQN
ncbi:hypothetical protein I4U23_015446 [Adineta vaga]|nr:hypothetical protein I4U23_015446 [Adineta vaga]